MFKKIHPEIFDKIIEVFYTKLHKIMQRKLEMENKMDVVKAKSFIRRMGKVKSVARLLKT